MTLHAWKTAVSSMKIEGSQLFEYLQPLVPKRINENKYSVFVGKDPEDVATAFRSGRILRNIVGNPYARVLATLGSGRYQEYLDFLCGIGTIKGDKRISFMSEAFHDSFEKAVVLDYPSRSAHLSGFWNDIRWLGEQVEACKDASESRRYLGAVVALVVCTALMGPDIDHLANLGYYRLGKATPPMKGSPMGMGLHPGPTAILGFITFPYHNLATFESTDKKVKLYPGDCAYIGKQPPDDGSSTVRIAVEGGDESPVSRLHCSVEQTKDAWRITDRSFNGTLVMRGGVEKHLGNGESLTLRHGDVICLDRNSEGFRFEVRE